MLVLFQTPYGGLYIERCFGILLAPARGVKHPDMRLLEMVRLVYFKKNLIQPSTSQPSSANYRVQVVKTEGEGGVNTDIIIGAWSAWSERYFCLAHSVLNLAQ